MDKSPTDEIIDGLLEYLREHYPGMDFTQHQDSRPTGNVLLVGDGGAYRLAVTETFLDGEEGAARPLQWIRDWDVAGYLRHSAGRVVTLKTTGPEIET